MIAHTAKVMPILSSALVLIGLDHVCRDQPRGVIRGAEGRKFKYFADVI